jgi:hypothetical protein
MYAKAKLRVVADNAPSTRRKLAEELLDLQASIADTLVKIEKGKEKLREISDQLGERFEEEIAGKGCVKVYPAKESKLIGVLPVLTPELFQRLAAVHVKPEDK